MIHEGSNSVEHKDQVVTNGIKSNTTSSINTVSSNALPNSQLIQGKNHDDNNNNHSCNNLNTHHLDATSIPFNIPSTNQLIINNANIPTNSKPALVIAYHREMV